MITKEEIKEYIINNPNYYFRMNNKYKKDKEIIQLVINNAYFNPKEKIPYYRLIEYIKDEKQLENAKKIISINGYISLMQDLNYINVQQKIRLNRIDKNDHLIKYIDEIIKKFDEHTQEIIIQRYGLDGNKVKLENIRKKYNYTKENIISIEQKFIKKAKSIIKEEEKILEEKEKKYQLQQLEKNIYEELKKYNKRPNSLLDLINNPRKSTEKYCIKTIGDYIILNNYLKIDTNFEKIKINPSAYLLYELEEKLKKAGYNIKYSELLMYPLSYYHINYYAAFFNVSYSEQDVTLKELLIKIEQELNDKNKSENEKLIKIEKYFKIKNEIQKIFNTNKTTEYESILETPFYKFNSKRSEDKKIKQNIKYLQLKQFNNLLEIIKLSDLEIEQIKTHDEKTYNIIIETLNYLKLKTNMTEEEIQEYKNKIIITNAYNEGYIQKYMPQEQEISDLRLLNLPPRIYNTLKRQNINTIEELLKLDINTLSGFPKIGEKTSKEIEECLKRYKENLEKDNFKIKTKSF